MEKTEYKKGDGLLAKWLGGPVDQQAESENIDAGILFYKTIKDFNYYSNKLGLKDSNGNILRKSAEDFQTDFGLNHVGYAELKIITEELNKTYRFQKAREDQIKAYEESAKKKNANFGDTVTEQEFSQPDALRKRNENMLNRLRGAVINSTGELDLTQWAFEEKSVTAQFTDEDKKLFKKKYNSELNNTAIATMKAARDLFTSGSKAEADKILENKSAEFAENNESSLDTGNTEEIKSEDPAGTTEIQAEQAQNDGKIVNTNVVPSNNNTPAEAKTEPIVKDKDDGKISANEKDILDSLPDSWSDEQRQEVLDKYRGKTTGKRASELINNENVEKQVVDKPLTAKEIREGKRQFQASDGHGNQIKKKDMTPAVANILFGKGSATDVEAYNKEHGDNAYAKDRDAGKLPSQEKREVRKDGPKVDAIDAQGNPIKVDKGVYVKGATLVDKNNQPQKLDQYPALTKEQLLGLDAAYDRGQAGKSEGRDKELVAEATKNRGYKRDRTNEEQKKNDLWSNLIKK